jgi:hypothetical protein
VSVVQGSGLGYGLGAIMSPPDERDFELAALYDATALGEELATWVPPSSYASPGMPAVLNQGDTPMCVAYSHSAQKAWQDHRDQGKYFDFDEPYYFRLIGGTAVGAVVRNALDRMRNYGYPVISVGQAGSHKIAAYYAVPKSRFAIQQAIYALGPITLGVHWMNSWFYPLDNGVLRTPDYVMGGHAIEAYGWDARGLRLRNSWGTSYGLGGDIFMPWWMALSSAVFEIWKSVDVIEKANTPTISFKAYASPRKALIYPGATVYGYDPKHPGGPVKKFVATSRGSSFWVASVGTVSFPISSTVPHGRFIRGAPLASSGPSGGAFALLLVVPSAVSAADHLAW